MAGRILKWVIMGVGISAVAAVLFVGLTICFLLPTEPRSKPAIPSEEMVSAIDAGDASAVDALLKQGIGVDSDYGEFIGMCDPDDRPYNSLLAESAAQGHEGVVRLLLQRGADPNRRARRGETPLFLAEGRPRIMKLLIRHGADPNIRLNGEAR